jgi:hypothetical protein
LSTVVGLREVWRRFFVRVFWEKRKKEKKRKKKWEKIEERGIMGVVGDKMGRLWRKLKAMINGAF